MNLVINARDAMPDGGSITLETSRVTITEDYIYSQAPLAPGDYITVSIADTGYGMDKDTLLKIFDPFFTTKEPGAGTGLGLSNVYGIVTQSGGDISVSSNPGAGTVFIVYLPVCKEEKQTVKFDRRNLHGSGTILLVEDLSELRVLTSRLLVSAGYEVLAAGSGEEALELFEKNSDSIDLVLSDVVMPGINGKEMVEQIIGKRPGMKVIYMSGYSDSLLLIGGVNDETTCFINKPFSLDSLLSLVKDFIS
jgi:two-component system cell cycle sensor histidine kinase/response regulator CckA